MLFPLLVASLAHAGSLVLGTGTVVVVTDIAPGDALARDRATLLGEVCAVGATPLSSSGDGWWKGTLNCGNGNTYTPSAIAVVVPGTSAQPRSVSASTIAQQLGKSIRFPSAGTASAPPAAASAAAPEADPRLYPARAPEPAPPEAIRRPIGAGEAVRIVGLSSQDAYYPDRGSVIGKTCYPTDHMSQNAEGWHGGPMRCWDGENYYFFMVALAVDPTHSSVDLPTGSEGYAAPVSPFAEDDGLSLPAGTLADGTPVVIRGISEEDAFYNDRAEFIGKECRVTGDLHPQGDGDWFGGGLTCKKKYYYFYKVRVDRK